MKPIAVGKSQAEHFDMFSHQRPSRHLPLKVPNVEFDFDVSVRQCLLSTHASKSNATLGTQLQAMIRTHHFDFNVRF